MKRLSVRQNTRGLSRGHKYSNPREIGAALRPVPRVSSKETELKTETNRPPFSIQSILVPIDFSPESEKALVYAVPFARQFGAKLILAHVIESVSTPDFAESFPLAIGREELVSSTKTHLRRILNDLRIEPTLVGNVIVAHGRAYREIVQTARSQKADLIVISTHGYTGLKHTFLGSTAERVVRHATCPVLVVRPREREFVTRTRKPSKKERI